MKTRRRLSIRSLDPKKLLIAFAFVAVPGLGLFTWHGFADEKTKGEIEKGTLVVADILRENRNTPREIVFWLDIVADAMPVVRGRGVRVDPQIAGNDFSEAGDPVANRPLTRLHNRGYDVGYDEILRNPAWVSYKVFEPKFPEDKRPGGFETDRRTRSRVRSQAYSNSGYDRGHMAPNNAIDLDYGPEAQKETFFMSNVTPQRHALNAGFWKGMEQRILRRYPRRFKEVRVTCGPVFDAADIRYLHEGVRVPVAFYLIVSDREEDSGMLRAQAYLVPAENTRENDDPSEYLTDIRTIETRTGLDFFPKLPPDSRETLETVKAIKAW